MPTNQSLVDNPFATKFIRPGAVEFQFPPEANLQQTLSCLENHQWCGQILGDHGSGKSTLVATLAPACRTRGKRVLQTTLTAGERRLPSTIDVSQLDSTSLVVIDGFEQLSWSRRQWLKQQVKARSAGLLVTTHSDLGLPTILTTSPSWDIFRQITAQLLHRGSLTFSDDEIRLAYEQSGANARDALFRLYDLYELKRARQQ